MQPLQQSPLGFGGEDDEDHPLVAVAVGAVVMTVLAVAFGLMALGFDYWWVAFPVGFGGLMPAAVGLAEWYTRQHTEEAAAETASETESATERDPREDALATLRDRYARGAIDEEEFERRLGAILETEDLDGARRYASRTRRDDPPEPVHREGVDPEFELELELDRDRRRHA
ncbi:SHOCT domain-containing protein [Halobium salinum]|uniref:SHOCT domain-containing protein n=1 Tax=Halobium salinum TaxID=1364940 RepID=A0ABD5P6V2_9EURY|nr:SHOCT domain-containing protein [Halobium salinum]